MGTPHHRFWICPAHRPLRISGERHHQHMGAIADENNLLYTRCLTAEKKVPFQPTEERTAVVHWAPLGPEQEALFKKKCRNRRISQAQTSRRWPMRMGSHRHARWRYCHSLGSDACDIASAEEDPACGIVGHFAGSETQPTAGTRAHGLRDRAPAVEERPPGVHVVANETC